MLEVMAFSSSNVSSLPPPQQELWRGGRKGVGRVRDRWQPGPWPRTPLARTLVIELPLDRGGGDGG